MTHFVLFLSDLDKKLVNMIYCRHIKKASLLIFF